MASTATILNGLIETSKDGENGFRSAAEKAHSAELRTILLKRAEDCALGARQLQDLVSRLGEAPEQGGSVSAALHRGWMDLKTAVSGDDDVAILEECERGEDVAKAAYREALDNPVLTGEARAVVQRQYDGVLRNHDQVRALRDRYRATAK